MNQRIRDRIDAVRSQPPKSKPLPTLIRTSPLLVTDLFLQQCLADVHAGRVYTIEEIAKKQKMEHEAVRRIYVKEPGVQRYNSMLRVPYCVFDRVVLRAMIQPKSSVPVAA
jgi:hypothetical protein